MIENTITIKGVRLDVSHDGEIVHSISPHDLADFMGLLSTSTKKLIYAKLYATGRIRSIPPSLRFAPAERQEVTL